jgi:hypothetical protein
LPSPQFFSQASTKTPSSAKNVNNIKLSGNPQEISKVDDKPKDHRKLSSPSMSSLAFLSWFMKGRPCYDGTARPACYFANNKNIKLEKIAIEWSNKVGALMIILLFKFR